jgi:nucleoside-diphosphate-sugar epimerase
VEDVVATDMQNPLASDLDHVLTHMESLWEELRGARIFVTGGTGFFGCWLLESLLWANDRLQLDASVVVLTRNRGGFGTKAPHLANHPALSIHDGDVRTFAFPEGGFSHVLHAATESSSMLDRRDPKAMFDVIVGGTRRVLDFAGRCGARRFLLTSSGAVYGRQPADLTHIPEDYAGGPDCTTPRSVYAEGKRAAEMLCAVYASRQLEPVIARGFAFVGPYLPLDVHFAVGNFIRDALAGGPIRVSGDGTPYRSYLYAADLAIWLWTILLRGQALRPYNVGSEEALTIRDVARTVARVSGCPTDVEVAQHARSGAAPDRYVPATNRAASELGLRPSIVLADAVHRTIAWHADSRQVSSAP